jgi:hypothetical protein
MKKRGAWKPCPGLGGIALTSEPVIKLPGKPDFWQGVEQVGFGLAVGAGPILTQPCAQAETGLAIGLGLTGVVWLLTGLNYFAISGVASSLGAYAFCKLKAQAKEGLTSR